MGHFLTKKSVIFITPGPLLRKVDCVYLNYFGRHLEVASYSGFHQAVCFRVVCACYHLKQPERVGRKLY